MSTQLTRVNGGEVLGPPLARNEADRIERRALTLYGDAQRTTVQFAAELRRLQDGQAHLARGYPNFGTYVERTFDGISAASASQISRQGAVLLVLEDNKRISLEGKGKDLPGTTGVRALASILKTFGEDAMLKVYDMARGSGRKVVAETVMAAAQELVRSEEPAELGPGSVDLDEPPEEPEEADEYNEDHQELYDRLQWLREHIDGVSDAISLKQPERAARFLDHLRDDIPHVREMVKDALGEEQ